MSVRADRTVQTSQTVVAYPAEVAVSCKSARTLGVPAKIAVREIAVREIAVRKTAPAAVAKRTSGQAMAA
jgi:hypothetical protein